MSRLSRNQKRKRKLSERKRRHLDLLAESTQHRNNLTNGQTQCRAWSSNIQGMRGVSPGNSGVKGILPTDIELLEAKLDNTERDDVEGESNPANCEGETVDFLQLWLNRDIDSEAITNDFAATKGCELPRPIKRMPEQACQVADCHANVIRKVFFHGGRAVWGWHFCLNKAIPNQQRIDAVFHCAWESPDGELIDITPQSERVMAGIVAGVFVPIPFFCEDKRYFMEYQVEDLGNGTHLFRLEREYVPPPERQSCSKMLT